MFFQTLLLTVPKVLYLSCQDYLSCHVNLEACVFSIKSQELLGNQSQTFNVTLESRHIQ